MQLPFKTNYLPAILWLIVILLLSSYPGNKITTPSLHLDKIVHVLIYAILTILLLKASYKQYTIINMRLKVNIFVILFGILYGGVMELLQHYVCIKRSGNLYDFTANGIGVIIGVLMFPLIVKALPIKKQIK